VYNVQKKVNYNTLNEQISTTAAPLLLGEAGVRSHAKGLYHCYLINNGKIVSQTKITVE